MAKEFILGNLEWLPLQGRASRQKAIANDAPLLTEAQCRVLSLVRQRLNTYQIAEALSTKPNTVYVQLRDARLRLGAATTKQAVEKAVDLGLIEGQSSRQNVPGA
jgi:DNA-binding CsgD family transcriptional regulator